MRCNVAFIRKLYVSDASLKQITSTSSKASTWRNGKIISWIFQFTFGFRWLLATFKYFYYFYRIQMLLLILFVNFNYSSIFSNIKNFISFTYFYLFFFFGYISNPVKKWNWSRVGLLVPYDSMRNFVHVIKIVEQKNHILQFFTVEELRVRVYFIFFIEVIFFM